MTTQTLFHKDQCRDRGISPVLLLVAALGCMVLGGFAVSHPAFADPAYNVTPIPSITITDAVTNTSLNKWGEVVGQTSSGYPAFWIPNVANGTTGTLLNLSTQTGFPATAHGGTATALNADGQVVGSAFVSSGGDANGTVSYLWNPKKLNSGKGVLYGAGGGNVTVFAVMSDGLSEYPSSINIHGQITGHGSYYRPYLFTPTKANGTSGNWQTDTTVGVTDFFVNDAKEVGGGVYGGSIPHYAGWDFAFEQKSFPPFSSTGIVSSPDWSTTSNADAVGMNETGNLIVQTVPKTVNAVHSYLVVGKKITDVGGGDGSFAYAINDYDMVTGFRIEGPSAVAFIYSNGAAYDLSNEVPSTVNSLPFSVDPQPGPIGINDYGQILTGGSDGAGDSVFLLTPAAILPGVQPQIAGAGIVPIGNGQYTQIITLTNTTGATLTGPVSLVFDKLKAKVSVVNPVGTTAFAPPVGSPYVTISSSDVANGTQAQVTVTFAAPSSAITYTPRTLVGTASR
jgi:hypothetical protein